MRTVWDLVGLAFFLVVAVWIGLVLLVSPERKPIVACAPVYFTFGLAQRLVTAGEGPQLLVTHEHQPRTASDRATLACLAYIDRYVRAAPPDEPR